MSHNPRVRSPHLCAVSSIRRRIGAAIEGKCQMLRTSDLEYELPAALIATRAVEPRDAARMMVVRRKCGSSANAVDAAGAAELARHAHIRDLASWLKADDLLVLNTTRVLPARLVGVRPETGAKVQGLYVGPASESASGRGSGSWSYAIGSW